LGWLDLPDQIGPYMARVGELADATEREGFQDVVFVGMGDSNLAAEAISHISGEKRCKRFFVLDSTDPAAVRAVDESLDLRVTLFVFASKSGKHIETQALLLYFLHRLRTIGIDDPGRHFIAVTEDNSYLATLAKTYRFRGLFFDPSGINGRYSSLIHFGLLLAGICRFDAALFLSCVLATRDLCRPSAPHDANPALALAAFLAAGVAEGQDKLLLIGTKSLTALTYRIGQLVGASTSKGGRGIVPICDGFPRPLETYQRGCLAVILRMRGDAAAEVQEAEEHLKQAGVPLVAIDLSAAEELGAELFKWELATALACAALHVNPFDEPDVREGRDHTAEILRGLLTTRELPSSTARVREKGIELYAEGGTRREISTLSLADALRTFFELKSPGGYLGIIAFTGCGPDQEIRLGRLREQLASSLGIPVLLSFGPRYLHCFGQVYKGGPPKGLFLILTAEPAEDIAIPGADYSFGQLQLALALGEFESLESRHKLVVRLHLTQGVEHGLAQLEQVMQKALERARRAAR
jgi:transaldolase/glucose-6-phosphate isomerase